MKYEIHGADSITGADRKIMVEALSEKEALSIASKQGLLTTNIYKIHHVPLEDKDDPIVQTDKIICPNPKCDYRGKPKKIARGNLLVAILLAIFSVILGVLLYIDLLSKVGDLSIQLTVGEPIDVAALWAVVSVYAICALAVSFPGFLYFIIKSGYISICPKCGLQIRNY
jgi:hypothetical protein